MKKISAVILALALCIGFSACGSDKGTAKNTAADEETTTSAAITTAAPETKSAESTTTTSAEKKAEDTEGEKAETTKKKKKKKKSSDSKSDKSDKKTDSKTDNAKVSSENAEKGIDNSVFGLTFADSGWVSATEFKSLVGKLASASSEQFKDFDFESFIGDMYFYGSEASSGYPTNIVVTTPIYQAEFTQITMDDIAEAMVTSVKQQWAAEPSISYASHEMVDRNGIRMLKIKANCEKMSAYFCDEYVFLANGNMCVISINYADAGSAGVKSFEKSLDSLKLK